MIGSTSSARDFAIIYPTAGLRLPRIKDDETRRAVIRAYNIVSAELFREARRPHDAGRDHSDAHARKRRSPSSNSSPSNLAPRSACSAARCRGRCRRSTPTIPTSTGSPSGTRCSASTATTTTTRSGRSAARSRSRRPSTAPAATRRCATRRPTSSTTISATSPMPAMPPPRASSSAASPGVSRNCASPSSKAAWAGRRSCSAI